MDRHPEGGADPALAHLDHLVARLEEAEQAYAILRDKGYGKPWMALDEIARLVPAQLPAGQAPLTLSSPEPAARDAAGSA